MGTKRILIVEDDVIAAEALRDKLVDLGYEVLQPASSGAAAIESALQDRPDLILMDIKLTGSMDGVEAAVQIQAELDTPVIYLTAFTDEAVMQRATTTAPYSYLVKPVRDRELQITIEMALYRHRMEGQLKDRNRELAALSQRLTEVQEHEQRLIAGELYDDISQRLAALLLRLGWLDKRVAQDSGAVACVDELKVVIEGVLVDVHDMAARLRPASLDKLGLMPALRQYAKQTARTHNFQLQFETTDAGPSRLPEPVESAVYWIAQELLKNIARHAGARSVGVTLERLDRQLRLTVKDDGAGFDESEAMQRGGLGLFGVRERAAFLGGTVSLETSPGRGTEVHVVVPLPPAEPAGVADGT